MKHSYQSEFSGIKDDHNIRPLSGVHCAVAVEAFNDTQPQKMPGPYPLKHFWKGKEAVSSYHLLYSPVLFAV